MAVEAIPLRVVTWLNVCIAMLKGVPLKNICESIKYQWFWIPNVIDDKGFGDHLYNIPKAKLRGIM
jgi:hypothetical protein